MANTIVLAGIVIVVAVVVVGVLVLSLGHNTATSTGNGGSRGSGTANQSSTGKTSQNATTTAVSSQSGQAASGSAGNMTYESASASGYSPLATDMQFNVSIPAPSGYKWTGSAVLQNTVCAVAMSNSSSSASLEVSAMSNGGNTAPYCPGGEGHTPIAVGLLEVFGPTGVNNTITAPFDSPYVMNYTINNTYSSWLVVVSAECTDGTCSLSMPSGCNIAQNATYQNATVLLGVCADQSPGAYKVTINPSIPGLTNINGQVALYYS
jgi:hypothetical protein